MDDENIQVEAAKSQRIVENPNGNKEFEQVGRILTRFCSRPGALVRCKSPGQHNGNPVVGKKIQDRTAEIQWMTVDIQVVVKKSRTGQWKSSGNPMDDNGC